MTTEPIEIKMERLQKVSIFQETPTELLQALAQAVEEVELERGALLFAKGDVGTAMYVIVSGQVRVHSGDHTIANLGAGEIVGELAALDPEPRSASVTATNATVLYRIDQTTLQALITCYPEITKGVISALAKRLRDTTEPRGAN